MKIVVAGYYGFGNLGDELLLQIVLQQLRAKPAVKIVVLSQQPEQCKDAQGVQVISRWNCLGIWQALFKARLLVMGGGGLVQDLTGPWTPVYYLGLIALAKVMGKKVILLGQGIGPLLRGGNRWLARMILRYCDRLVTRDLGSWNWCQVNQLPMERIRLGADLAWSYPPVEQSDARNLWLVCLRPDWLSWDIPEWLPTMVALARSHQRLLCVTVFSEDANQVLVGALKAKQSELGYEFRASCQDTVWDLFQSAEIVISMRYHGIIIGALSGALVTGFGRDQKINGLLDELAMPRFVPQRAYDCIQELLANRLAYQQRLQQALAVMKARVEKNWESLDTGLKAFGVSAAASAGEKPE